MSTIALPADTKSPVACGWRDDVVASTSEGAWETLVELNGVGLVVHGDHDKRSRCRVVFCYHDDDFDRDVQWPLIKVTLPDRRRREGLLVLGEIAMRIGELRAAGWNPAGWLGGVLRGLPDMSGIRCPATERVALQWRPNGPWTLRRLRKLRDRLLLVADSPLLAEAGIDRPGVHAARLSLAEMRHDRLERLVTVMQPDLSAADTVAAAERARGLLDAGQPSTVEAVRAALAER